MTFDPRAFPLMVVADACSVWNVLSVKRLFEAATEANVTFLVTPMVLYECLQKKRTMTPAVTTLMSRLSVARTAGKFPVQECDIDDLLAVTRQCPKGLSSGELSCIAMSYRYSTIYFMTDERQAKHVARSTLGLEVQTTPRLYGWLLYRRLLWDSDHQALIEEHERHERRPLTVFFNEARFSALEYQLMERQIN